MKRLLAATFFACTVAATGCSSGDDRSLNLDDLRNADAPYYSVGSSFDGYDVSDVLPYRAGEASILYWHVQAAEWRGRMRAAATAPAQVVSRCRHDFDLRRARHCPASGQGASASLEGGSGANSKAGCCFRHGRQLLKRAPLW